jgi:membrane protease YdiL (CAAX protease family)
LISNKWKLINFALIVFFFTFGTLGVPSTDQVHDFSLVKSEYIIIGIIFILVVTFIHFKDILADFKEYFKTPKRHLLITLKYFAFIVVGFVATRILSIWILGLINSIPENDTAIYETFKVFPFYIIFVTNIYAPYVEEIIFRKSLYDLVKSKWIFIILSGIVFGLLHTSITLAAIFPLSSWDLNHILTTSLFVLPYVFFACTLAYAYVKEKNIFIPIGIRMIYNIIVTLIALTSL